MTVLLIGDGRTPLRILTAFTLLFAWQDQRRRSVSILPLIVFGGIGLGMTALGHRSVLSCLLALLPGMALLLLSAATRGGIGLGDAIYVCACGLYLDLSFVLLVLSVSLLTSGVAALWMLAKRWFFAAYKNEKTALPYLVFMLPGIALLWFCGGGAG